MEHSSASRFGMSRRGEIPESFSCCCHRLRSEYQRTEDEYDRNRVIKAHSGYSWIANLREKSYNRGDVSTYILFRVGG